MRRRRLLAAILVLCVLAGGAIAVVLVTGGSNPRERILGGRNRVFHTAVQLSRRLKPVKAKIVHVHPTRRIPHISLAALRRHKREPLNETSRPRTRSAARVTNFIKSSSVAATEAQGLSASPQPTDLKRDAS